MPYQKLSRPPARQGLAEVAVSVIKTSAKGLGFRVSIAPSLAREARLSEGTRLSLYGDAATRTMKLVAEDEPDSRTLSHVGPRYTISFPVSNLKGFLSGKPMKQTNCTQCHAVTEAIEFKLPNEPLK